MVRPVKKLEYRLCNKEICYKLYRTDAAVEEIKSCRFL